MQGQRQVSAGAAGLRCGGGGGPETLAVRSGGRGRGPGLRARVRWGRARREIGRVPAVGVRVGKVGWRGTPAGAGREVPWAAQRQPWDSDGSPCVCGFLKRPERRGSASGGDPEQVAPGPERGGDTGVSRCSGSLGGRENWEWPLSESGGR